MNKNIPLLFLLLFANNLFAQQPCNDDMIMNVKGKWEKTNDANMKPANQAQTIIRIDKMQKILHSAYPDLKGMEAKWYRSMIKNPLIQNGPIPYQLTSPFFYYYCNTNVKKLLLGKETAVWFHVYANQFNWFLDVIENSFIQGQPVYLLRKKTGEIKGYPVYEGNYNQKSNTGTYYSRAIILTRNGEMPYVAVTRKQFLTAFISQNEKRFAKELEFQKNRTVKSDETEEAEKKKNLEILERVTPPAKLASAKENYLRNYVTFSQQKEKWIANMKNDYEENMKPANLFLSNSTAQELQQPAILDHNNRLEFKQFVTEEKGGMLVRLNPDYFDTRLPKYMPQFLIVYWEWNIGLTQNYWRTQIEKNFDFDALKAMLDN